MDVPEELPLILLPQLLHFFGLQLVFCLLLIELYQVINPLLHRGDLSIWGRGQERARYQIFMSPEAPTTAFLHGNSLQQIKEPGYKCCCSA